MRTVHEIETGKPPEPVLKILSVPDQKSKRRRSPSFTENGNDDLDIFDLDETELSLSSASQRYRYLKRKLRWATERNEHLKEELETAEDNRWRSWAQKERLLDQVLVKEKIDLGYHSTEI
jgi:hypothetical protein